MTVNYSTSHILAKGTELRAADIDRLNEILAEAGLGRPLRHPGAGDRPADGSVYTVLPLAGADPMAVRDTVRAAAERGGDMPSLIPDYQYDAATQDAARSAGLFSASGKKSGHGLVAWLPAPAYEMPASPPWPDPPRPPVIALLDSGVQRHNWLPGHGGPPFVIDATHHGWAPPAPLPDPEEHHESPDYGTHWGHATFVAGLIRKKAPGAQVLSMRVMDVAGKVSERNVTSALEWLATTEKIQADIVLMAFGRRERPGDHDLENLRGPIRKLAKRKVWIVASAGNDGSDRPVYPAAFATEPELVIGSRPAVVSVGALATPTERAPYSNFGPWVHRWGKGTNVISIMPLTTRGVGVQKTEDLAGPAPQPGDGYAWWSGTSFAAATCAGVLAAGLHSGHALPEPPAGA